MSFWGCNRRKEADRTVVTIDGYQEVPQSEEALLQAVTHQPVSVGTGWAVALSVTQVSLTLSLMPSLRIRPLAARVDDRDDPERCLVLSH